MKAVHYIVLILGFVVTICGSVGQAFPQHAALCATIAALAAQLASVLGVLSPSATAGAPMPAPVDPGVLAATVQNGTAAVAKELAAPVAPAAPVKQPVVQ